MERRFTLSYDTGVDLLIPLLLDEHSREVTIRNEETLARVEDSPILIFYDLLSCFSIT